MSNAAKHNSGPFVVVGDALLDRDLDGRVERLCPDAPVPRGRRHHAGLLEITVADVLAALADLPTSPRT